MSQASIDRRSRSGLVNLTTNHSVCTLKGTHIDSICQCLQLFSEENVVFQEKILERSGIGDQTGLSDGEAIS